MMLSSSNMWSFALIFALISGAPAGEQQQDFDKDGIADTEDDCPTDPGTKAGRGCPAGVKEPEPATDAKPAEIEVKSDRLDVKETIEFRTGSASVEPASFALLRSIAASIQGLPNTKKIVVAGHTDNRGNARKNERLSEDRAQAVIAHLVRAGVARERLSAIGHGPNRPIASNASEEGRKKNRRVEFLIVDGP